ncbi:hypothetical protein GOP47_0016366 [Adiantum capillus-veneris]|uniref:General transcription factor 3C polypeptide 3 n=1 Tax=Adiantum capillus-veneris TaxID=13818 RepID=A0A9D4ZCW8_ADICA|nr:hypothetical protein GOP47_0016366 [Adiantum capillus-veneris]
MLTSPTVVKRVKFKPRLNWQRGEITEELQIADDFEGECGGLLHMYGGEAEEHVGVNEVFGTKPQVSVEGFCTCMVGKPQVVLCGQGKVETMRKVFGEKASNVGVGTVGDDIPFLSVCKEAYVVEGEASVVLDYRHRSMSVSMVNVIEIVECRLKSCCNDFYKLAPSTSLKRHSAVSPMEELAKRTAQEIGEEAAAEFPVVGVVGERTEADGSPGGDAAEGEEEEEDQEEEEEDDGDGEGNGEEEEDEDGQEVPENEFEWHFGVEIDPLAFAEMDVGGAQPYEQFERFEYEALAARKRKRAALLEKNQKAEGKDRQQQLFGASIDEIRAAASNTENDLASLEEMWELSGFGSRSRKGKKRKRKVRRRAKGNPQITKKLGEANLLYATSEYDKALQLLEEIVRLAPNMPEPYHTLGLVYNSMGNRKKAINFYMLAAHLKPKDVSLWKRIAAWSLEEGLSTGQAIYCLRRAAKSDPEDVLVKWELASLFAEIKEFAKAAETYEAILTIHPTDVEACKMAAKMRQQSGRADEATKILKKLLHEHPTEADLTVVNLLADFYMESRAFSSVITCIEEARTIYCAGQGLPLDLAVKTGIAHAHLGNETVAKEYCEALHKEQAEEVAELILQVGDAYKEMGQHKSAMQYYAMLDGVPFFQNKSMWTKVSECHLAMKDHAAAVELYKKIVQEGPADIDARFKLASLLLEMDRAEEAVAHLVPSQDAHQDGVESEQAWWSDGKKVFEAELYNQQYIKGTKRLPKSVLLARAKWLEDADGLPDAFIRFNPAMPSNLKLKASRARKALARLEAEKEERRAAFLASGLDWRSDEEEEYELKTCELDPKVHQLPNLFEDEEHFNVLMQTCKVLATKKRYGEALEIINQALRVAHPSLMSRRPEVRALGTEITIKAKDAKRGFDCVRHMVLQQPYSLNAWNWYYQVVCSSEGKIPKHHKFLLSMRNKYTDCIPPIMIYGHQFSIISQPQGALREYLQAYKLKPDDPFINLCVGISFINLSLGFRLTNRNQCVVQGFAFLHKYQELSEYSQESNYNLARAYHHVGFVTIAVQYYEKVLAHREKDHPQMNTVEDPFVTFGDVLQKVEVDKGVEGLCDLRREAAFNLHLIYKKSGSMDLARQVLQDFCNL